MQKGEETEEKKNIYINRAILNECKLQILRRKKQPLN